MADTICNNCEYFSKDNIGGYGNCGAYKVTVYQQDEDCRYFKQKYGNVKDVKDSLNLRVVRIANDRDAKGLPCGTLVVKGYSTFFVGKNNELIPVLTEDDTEEREDKSMCKDSLEEYFVKGAKECSSPENILNWYRNLYYKEEQNTERRIVAEALNEFFVKKLPELLKESKIVATDAVDAYIYANLKNAVDTQFLYEDVIQPVIDRYKNEVKNDKV